jgi:hypothetical protein
MRGASIAPPPPPFVAQCRHRAEEGAATTARAIREEVVLAESDLCVIVEGIHSIPPESVRREFLASSLTTTVGPWKGVAQYHDAVGETGSTGTPPGSTRRRSRRRGVRIEPWRLS